MKRKLKCIVVVGLVILGIGFFAYEFRVPRQACACLPPDYVAHFTEEQALAFIKTRLEDVGLNVVSEVPQYTVEQWGGRRWGNQVGIDLFDEERSVAITFINMYDDVLSSVTDAGGGSYRWMAERIETEFTESFDGLFVGVFYNSSVWRPWDQQSRWRRSRTHTAHEVEFLAERLERQIQEFIEQLQAKGMID